MKQTEISFRRTPCRQNCVVGGGGGEEGAGWAMSSPVLYAVNWTAQQPCTLSCILQQDTHTHTQGLTTYASTQLDMSMFVIPLQLSISLLNGPAPDAAADGTWDNLDKRSVSPSFVCNHAYTVRARTVQLGYGNLPAKMCSAPMSINLCARAEHIGSRQTIINTRNG